MTDLPKVLDDPLVGELARLGVGYDDAPGYPVDSIAVLARSGLLRRFAPVASGGDKFGDPVERHYAMLDALRRVGRGDLSVGRLFEGHVNALALFDWYATADQNAWLRELLDQDAVFGVWATQPAPGVTLIEDDDGARLQGAKSFASGAGGIDFAIVTVRPADGTRRLAIVAANETERTDASGWRVRGMRASMSGTYDLTGYRIDDPALLGAPGDYDREPRFTAGAWRFTAVQLGGIEALLAETRAMLSDAARADALSRAALGHAIVATRTAWLWVREAALRAGREDADAAAFVRITRGVVERAALDVMEHAARLVGTRSAFTEQRVDKITRDLSLYLRQAGPDQVRDTAVRDWIEHDCWGEDPLW
ncbi:acyl-CoA dehydrogenase family protein [Sphingomonas radiodurans]|uniref:acyl-CoA dehydrogenase family protein n=1 Tax=Sphingomonas radiodurans TaxID=2890321 RepID=UPI001E61543A|nr:acyl-CoA dehydrogenase family protein [Sphingomonas radiodurans]WBH15836.1 acyl-CoA/acyl-ACP dehydrogenase [Sphingomonas radiodurans]